MSFHLDAGYKPAGDQPEAIKQLTQGLEAGARFQTLLGVTGSGKSVRGDTPVYIRNNDEYKKVEIGPLIDEYFYKHSSQIQSIGETEVVDVTALDLSTWSFSPETGKMSWKTIRQFSRHQCHDKLLSLTTSCGRSVVVTGDHNFYVLRKGYLQLMKTTDISVGDYIPIPRQIEGPTQPLDYIPLQKTIEVGAVRPYYVALPEKVRAKFPLGQKTFSREKIWRVCNEGERVLLHDALVIVHDRDEQSRLSVGPQHGISIPLSQKITNRFLRLLGYYIAEGHTTANYVVFSNGDEEIIKEITTESSERGFGVRHRPGTYDYQCNSVVWTDILREWCGEHAYEKKLPLFWTELNNEQLSHLLAGYFSADGGVEAGFVSATTVSKELASDILYALLRFGIIARMKQRSIAKSKTNQHGKAWRITITGANNLHIFAKDIGFTLGRKQRALQSILKKYGNTNVDIIPISGNGLKQIRLLLGLDQKEIARGINVARSYVGLIESGKRHPSREVTERLIGYLDGFSHLFSEVKLIVENWKSLLQLFWSPIAIISEVHDKDFVYDFAVQDNETFLAGRGGLFVHNTFTMANVAANLNRPTLVIAHNKTLAAQLCNEFREFFPNNCVEYFVSYYDYYQPEAYMPSSDTYIEKEATINEEIDRLRHACTQALLTRRDVIIVASVSCIYGLGAPEAYEKMHMKLSVGQVITRGDLLRHLVRIQYTRTTTDLKRGSFRARGDVYEIMPISEEVIVRVECDNQSIREILIVDPVTRKTIENRDWVWIYPAKHFITPEEDRNRAITSIRSELKERLEFFTTTGKLLEAERLERRVNNDMAMLAEVGYCNGIENYSRPLSGRPAGAPPDSLLAYFPKDFLCFIDESHVTVSQIQGMFNGDQARKRTLIDYGFRLPSAADNRPLMFNEFLERVPQIVFVSATPGPYERQNSAQIVEQVIRPTGLLDPKITVLPVTPKNEYKGQIDDLIERIVQHAKDGERVLVTTLTKKMAEDLTEFLTNKKIKVQYLHSDVETIDRIRVITDFRRGKYDVLVGVNLLREGLDLPEVTLVAILDADKEGFLRSETALIQTIGRAARNVKGEVILYADDITPSMDRAMKETERRREKQLAYNKEHGITPKTIEKAIKDIMESFSKGDDKIKDIMSLEEKADTRTPEERIKEKEQQMREAAKNLEFELAALLRDEIAVLKKGEPKKKPVRPRTPRSRR